MICFLVSGRSCISFIHADGAIVVSWIANYISWLTDVVLITAKMDAMVDANRDIRPGIGHFIERYWNLQ